MEGADVISYEPPTVIFCGKHCVSSSSSSSKSCIICGKLAYVHFCDFSVRKSGLHSRLECSGRGCSLRGGISDIRSYTGHGLGGRYGRGSVVYASGSVD